MSVTAKMIAGRMGLSEAAISMALNNKPGVSAATRKRVLEVAREMGYDFSRKISPSGSICFVIYKKSGAVVGETPFFSQLSDGISLKCQREQFDLTVKYLYDGDEIRERISDLHLERYSGVIILATEMDTAVLSHFSGLSVPLVILDAYFETQPHNYVIINNKQGAFIATSHLIQKRKVQPGYLRSAYSIANFEERADGFYKAIRTHGFSTSMSPVHKLTPSEEGAYEDMKSILQSGTDLARAYFADNDHIAIGAIHALQEFGYRIPEDVAVVGFDDIPLSNYFQPTLTTVEVPKQFLGETAVARIMELMESPGGHPTKISISTSLKRRKSV